MISDTRRKWLVTFLAVAVLLIPAAMSMAQIVNSPPDAVDDSVLTLTNTPVMIDAVANDTDVDGNLDPTSAALFTMPTNGIAVSNGDGTFDYTPNAGFTGMDSFMYQVCDSDLTLPLCDTATITISVVENTAPDAVDDTATTAEDTPVTTDVAFNDLDAEFNLDPASVTITTDAANGVAVSNGDGTVTYTPKLNFFGSDSYGYTICDTLDACDSATVTIEVTPVNDPPDCSAAYSSVGSLWPPNHRMISVNVLGVTDVENDPITLVITNITSDEPDNGTGDGDTTGDTAGAGSDTGQVRAERAGSGDGRVYTIEFQADDGQGGMCDGSVIVAVPHDQSSVEPLPEITPEPSADQPGDFGCGRPGNACNAPGHNKSNQPQQSSSSSSHKGNSSSQNQGNGNQGNNGNHGQNGPGNGNGNGKGNGKNK